jgi:hypothetical protein
MWSSFLGRYTHKDSRKNYFVFLWFLYNLLRIFEVTLVFGKFKWKKELEKSKLVNRTESSLQAGLSWARAGRLGPGQLNGSGRLHRQGAATGPWWRPGRLGAVGGEGLSRPHQKLEGGAGRPFFSLRRSGCSPKSVDGGNGRLAVDDDGEATLRRQVESKICMGRLLERSSSGRQQQMEKKERGGSSTASPCAATEAARELLWWKKFWSWRGDCLK